MTPVFTSALLASVLMLCSCALPQSRDTPSQNVKVGGDSYVLSQITAGTWVATKARESQALPDDAASKAALVAAIEKASGCKVTDSDYSQQGRQLDAQVDCAGRLSN